MLTRRGWLLTDRSPRRTTMLCVSVTDLFLSSGSSTCSAPSHTSYSTYLCATASRFAFSFSFFVADSSLYSEDADADSARRSSRDSSGTMNCSVSITHATLPTTHSGSVVTFTVTSASSFAFGLLLKVSAACRNGVSSPSTSAGGRNTFSFFLSNTALFSGYTTCVH